jgi:thiamine-phosphate pyrophosphorylase
VDGRALTAAELRDRLGAARILLVVTEAACKGPWEHAVERALASGAVGVVQLREKAPGDAEFLARVRRLAALARPAGALVTLNDRAHLVREADGDGVHLGTDDLPPAQARAMLGPRPLIGISTHDEAEVAAARGLGADYVGLGPCFATQTKRLSRPPRGADLVAACVHRTDLPVFPIGGITAENAADLVRAGATRVAVGAGILGADDPLRAALRIRAALP